MSLPSLGGSSSNKKSKDKSSISRSQSQRPAGDQECRTPRLTAVSLKLAGNEAAGKAEAGRKQDSLTEPKSQHEPASDVKNTSSGPTAEYVSPPGGSSTDKQGITQADADLTTDYRPEPLKEVSSPPLSQGNDQTLPEGKDKGNQNPESIYMWVFKKKIQIYLHFSDKTKSFTFFFSPFVDNKIIEWGKVGYWLGMKGE